MQEWYNSIKISQKVLIYILSTMAILIFGIGLVILAVLVYLELGSDNQERHIFALFKKIL